MQGYLKEVLKSGVKALCELIHPLPPIREAALESHHKEGIIPIIQHLFQRERTSFELLTLFEKCRAIKIGRYIFGSCKSRFTTASRVMVLHKEKMKLAEIQYFLKCAVRMYSDCQTKTLWLAAVSFYFQHQCHVSQCN